QTDTIAARSSVLPTAPAHHPHHKNPTSRTPNLMAGYFLVVALDHHRWPNKFFVKQGLFNLTTAHALAVQSSRR
ncbi:MAG: hypothetical protein NT013_00405, partial [Planctomycetia bacterium]|nr:hypothetical protein [Planctomycetia bacterium]